VWAGAIAEYLFKQQFTKAGIAATMPQQEGSNSADV
jgi:hypothetical protein